MKTSPLFSHPRSSAFTLIELLTVMAIIVILAGLILGTAGYANRKAAINRAQTEIKGLETAINSYQVDYGAYPRDYQDKATDNLNARDEATISSKGNPDNYKASCKYLFKAISGYYDTSGAAPSKANTKVYFPFKSGQLSPSTAFSANGSIPDPDKVDFIADPFGLSYGYSTAAIAEAEAAAATAAQSPGSTPAPQSKGYNPTFDLWSSAGYGTGRPVPSGISDKSTLWITNWTSQ